MRSGKVIHGDARRGKITRLRKIWKQIKTRCYNSNSKDYQWYGGKGITMCTEWRDSYIVFRDWAVSNGYADNLTIDRIDSDGHYEPDNCRWVDMKTQNQNKKFIKLYEYNGEQHCLAEWARILGVSRGLLKDRVVKLHWDFKKAVETPARHVHKK